MRPTFFRAVAAVAASAACFCLIDPASAQTPPGAPPAPAAAQTPPGTPPTPAAQTPPGAPPAPAAAPPAPPAAAPGSAPASPYAPPAAAPALAAPVEPAPAASARNDGLAVGFTLHRFHDDFALGGLVSSPSLLDGMVRLTAGGGVGWYPHAVNEEGFEAWKPYGHMRLVVEAGARIPSTPLRLYGFGGATALVLPNDLSSKKVRFGGIGGFGFEFRFQNVVERRDAPVSYFVELGGIGTGATANRLPGHPIFANGFLITTGLRAYF